LRGGQWVVLGGLERLVVEPSPVEGGRFEIGGESLLGIALRGSKGVKQEYTRITSKTDRESMRD